MERNQPRGATRARSGLSSLLPLNWFPANERRPRLDVAALEDRTLYSATPLVLGEVEIDTAEDAPDQDIDLRQYFSVDNAGGTVQYSIVSNDHATLFDNISVDNFGHLLIDLAADAFGEADLSIRAINGGQIELLPMHINVESVNDAPTAISLQSVTVTDLASGRTIIDLFAAFDDIEDDDSALTFQIAENTNAALFSSIELDEANGKLILHHAAGATGTAQLTIVATDTGNLSVGLGTAPTFQVYDEVGLAGGGLMNDYDDIGLSYLSLWTHWFFFELESGGYNYDSLDVEKLTRYLENFSDDMADQPLVFDIENDVYINTPEGRDRFAEVFALANQLRPDLEISLYRFMPERSWSIPVNWQRSLDHTEAGFASPFVTSAPALQQAYLDWLARNEDYRTENVSAEFGGIPLADMIDAVNPSLYTFYRNVASDPYWRQASFDGATDTFTVDGPSFDTVDVVRLRITTDGQFPTGMAQWTDYYVVNADGKQFQLAATPGGPAIDFGADFTGEIYVGAVGPTWENMWHDPNVIYWQAYAEYNIAEARKFGEPVYAWISPSIKGVGNEYLEGDFFRWQLEILRPLVDGIVIYDMPAQTGEFHQNQGWWTGMRDFMETMDIPAATVSITIPVSGGQGTDPDPSDDIAAPVANSDGLNVLEDRSITFNPNILLGNDRDPQGLSLSVSLGNGPANGQLEILSPTQWRYTPNTNFHGQDTFTYRAFNGTEYSAGATVRLYVSNVNDAPVAVGDSFQAVEDQTLVIAPVELLANDRDADGDRLQFQIVTGPSHGTLSRNADGTLYYRPDANFYGTDSFQYQVTDGLAAASQPATVQIAIAAVNDRPIAVADRFATDAGKTLTIQSAQLLANDVDAERDPLQLQIVEGPANGTLTCTADGNFLYVSHAGFSGQDEFTYRVSDGRLNSVATVVAIDVAAAAVPAGMADRFTTREDVPIIIRPDQLLTNDPGANNGRFQVELVDTAQHGTVRQELNGAIVYMPERNFSGVDRFGYRIVDGTGRSEVVAVHLTVTPINDAPLAKSDVYRVRTGTPLRVGGTGVLANDSDAEGDSLRTRLVTGPSSGTLTLNANGSFEYRPKAGFVGTDTFQYRVTDARGASSVARATIRVESAPAATSIPNLQPLLAQDARGMVPLSSGPTATALFSGLTTLNPNSDDESTLISPLSQLI